MKRWKVILLLGIMILGCGACGQDNVEDTTDESIESETVIDEGKESVDESKEELDEPVTEEDNRLDETFLEDEYQISFPIVVEGNRELTLSLHGRRTSEEYEQYGIGRITVSEGEEILQEILTKDAISQEWEGDENIWNGYTEGYTQDGGLATLDMNFDGSGDIGIQGWITSGANIPYYYWLWNAKTEQFEYAFCLCNAEPDMETRQVVTYTRVGAGCYYTTFYQYDENGALKKVKEIIETYDENGTVETETNEYDS